MVHRVRMDHLQRLECRMVVHYLEEYCASRGHGQRLRAMAVEGQHEQLLELQNDASAGR